MEVTIRISDKTAFLLLIGICVVSAVGMVVAYGTGDPTMVGHTWDEITCDGCVATGNLADGSVTSPKIPNNAVTTGKIPDNAVTSSKISSLEWSKLNNIPPGLSDGDDGITSACNWNGWLPECLVCSMYGCAGITTSITQIQCDGTSITGVRKADNCCLGSCNSLM